MSCKQKTVSLKPYFQRYLQLQVKRLAGIVKRDLVIFQERTGKITRFFFYYIICIISQPSFKEHNYSNFFLFSFFKFNSSSLHIFSCLVFYLFSFEGRHISECFYIFVYSTINNFPVTISYM